jgi:hypothetical protein
LDRDADGKPGQRPVLIAQIQYDAVAAPKWQFRTTALDGDNPDIK